MPTIFSMDTDAVPKNSTVKITAAFTDDNEAAVTPKTLTWKLTDEDGNVINNRSSVTVTNLSTSVDIALTGNDLPVKAGYTQRWLYLILSGTYDSDLGTDLSLRDWCKIPVKDNI